MAPQSLPGQAERQLRRFVSLGSPQAAGILGAYPERALKLAAVQGLLADHRSQQTQRGPPDGTAREQLGQRPPPSGHGTAPLTWRLSDTNLRSFRTSCRCLTFVMFSSGLAPTTIRSASLPTSTVPSSAPTPHTAAAWRVAATSVCHGVAPSRTHSPISSSAAYLRGRMSEPNAILTPASRALRNHVACTSDAASARQPSAGESPRSATQSASNGLVTWLAVRWVIARVGTYQVWCSSRSAMHSSSMM